MRSVHYFPRYSQPENVVTNNSLLLLVRLHELSRFKFENLIEKICAANDDVEFAPQWLRFAQQVGSGKSVVDGFVAQDSVKIAVETKMSGSFSSDQLQRHLSVFGEEQYKLLILLSPSLDPIAEKQLAQSRRMAKELGVELVHTSFERLIAVVRNQLSEFDETMHALVDDFEDFCSQMKLLPTDEYTLFAPPCGKSFSDNEEYRLYYCPSDRNIRKARYLGIYAQRKIRSIGRISKVIDCAIDTTSQTVKVVGNGSPLTPEEQRRILGAAQNAPTHRWNIASGHRFYLCDEWAPTSFHKRTPNGIMNRRYFDLQQVLGAPIPQAIDELAEALRQHTWD